MIASTSTACATAWRTRRSQNFEFGAIASIVMYMLFGETKLPVFTPGSFSNSATIAGGTASIQSSAPVLKAATRVRSSGMIFTTTFLTVGRASLFQ